MADPELELTCTQCSSAPSYYTHTHIYISQLGLDNSCTSTYPCTFMIYPVYDNLSSKKLLALEIFKVSGTNCNLFPGFTYEFKQFQVHSYIVKEIVYTRNYDRSCVQYIIQGGYKREKYRTAWEKSQQYKNGYLREMSFRRSQLKHVQVFHLNQETYLVC